MSVVFKGLYCSYWMQGSLPFKNKQEIQLHIQQFPALKKERKNWAKSTLLVQN